MRWIHILVEGPTEEGFVKKVLTPYLEDKGIYPTPLLLETKSVDSGPHSKGGVSTYGKIKRDIRRLIYDSSVVAVTTMIDFYGLPSDFPAKKSLSLGTCYQRVGYLEEAFAKDVDHAKFIPYLALHEFEALLFASPGHIAKKFPRMKVQKELHNIRNQFATPEEINEEPSKTPFKRLQMLLPEYQKPLHGPLIAAEIGIDRVRQECPHFNDWLAKLEALAET